jgi:hypothetical protein
MTRRAGSDSAFEGFDTTCCTLLWGPELKGFIHKVEPRRFTLLDLS